MQRIAAVLLSVAGVFAALAAAGCAADSSTQVSPQFVNSLCEKVKPSLVCVKYTFAGELNHIEIIGQGVVVGEDGLVMTSIYMVPEELPNNQMTDFKIIIPGDEEKELPAVFEGRDERSNVAFVRTVEKQHWASVKFQDVPVSVGEEIVSVGLLPKSAGYHAYVTEPTVSAILRGPVPEVMVSASGLATVGSPVFNARGQAIGLVNRANNPSVQLNRNERDTRGVADAMAIIHTSVRGFVPSRDFLASINDPPAAAHPLELPWMGIIDPAGLTKDVAEYFKLKDTPAVQIGAVIPDTGAAKAGLQAGDIIVAMNGKPLERGDEPEETGLILIRQIRRMKVGSQVTFSILRNDPHTHTFEHKDLTLTLSQRPTPPNEAKRYFAEDTGMVVRDLTFDDRYPRKLQEHDGGVLVALVKESSAAASASLEPQDILTQLNGQPITDVDQFEKLYKDFRKNSPKEAVILEILRGSKTETIRIEPPQ